VLEIKGFSNIWYKWIESIIQGGHVGIKINDQVGKNQTKKGLWQGDPLSPLLFNIVVDIMV
jgi:retron-type reverse transcriptase